MAEQKPDGYPLPASVEFDRRRCIRLYLPDDWEWYSVAWGHLYELSKWWNWQRDDTHQGKVMADWFREELDRARRVFDNCDDCTPSVASANLTLGDGGLVAQEDFDIGCGPQITPYTDPQGWGYVTCFILDQKIAGWGVRDDFSSVRDVIAPSYQFVVNSGGFVEYWQTELYWIDKNGLYHFWESMDGTTDGSYQHVILSARKDVKGLFYRIIAYHSVPLIGPPATYLTAFEYQYLIIEDCPPE